jgi:alanyl-tRNA synthetase
MASAKSGNARLMISENVLPSNKDRGYVIRRLIRRSVLHSMILGINDNYLSKLVPVVVNQYQEAYPDLIKSVSIVEKIISKEEIAFKQTIKNGIKEFNKLLEQSKSISGKDSFRLFDTFGFPIELTLEYAEKNNAEVDVKGFYTALEEHREKSKSTLGDAFGSKQNPNLLAFKIESNFTYDLEKLESKIIGIFDENFNLVDQSNGIAYIVLDNTCFFATKGGQEHDIGLINDIVVESVISAPNGQHLHKVNSNNFKVNQIVKVEIDSKKRLLTRKNHSTVHLVQAYLNKFISSTIKQSGSYLNDEKFSFDFSYFDKLSPDQMKDMQE